MKEAVNGFIREIRFDIEKQNENMADPQGQVIIFMLKKLGRAVTFKLTLNQFLKHRVDKINQNEKTSVFISNVSSHSPFEEEGDVSSRHESCEFLDGKVCYSYVVTGSGIKALNCLQAGGEDLLWNSLEECFNIFFPDLENLLMCDSCKKIINKGRIKDSIPLCNNCYRLKNHNGV